MFKKLLWGGLVAALLAALAVVTPASAAQSLRLQYRTSATGATADQVEPWFNLVNSGTTSVPLSGVKIRYYFKADSAAQQYRFACSWAVLSCSTVTGVFGTLSPGTATADRYLEVGFTAGTLAAGASTGDLQLRFYRADWQTLTQSDDYSFSAARTTYGDWTKVAVYTGGSLAWGTPPAGGTGPSPTPTPTPTVPPTNPGGDGVVFDDFAYTGSADPAITAHNWTVRTNSGGPGVPGASWPASNVTFPSIGTGNKALQLRAATDGTTGGTSQSEFLNQRKFFEGTYAARVKFSDTPESGPDGDNIVQTFFTITPLAADLDPNYSEQDFEYLPNGGWGAQGPIMYATTWETYRNEPWLAVNVHQEQTASYNGWHDLVLQVAGGNVKYYIDGVLFAQHGDIYYPETPQSVNFNLWFIGGGLVGSSTPRAYNQQVDWFYFSKNEVVAPAEVVNRVNGYRTTATTWKDTVPNP
ncbi:cellulose binding domain-containing protein [Streptosporangium sp. 'caverna']|uniref:cellulose binding domain-containing protein n=1 Tax=Streptosporangium sp. 'caverna' TaxID=2202249 RepID=UPI000D7D7849|nr:cellulose binding domain-containing protein [Streptosporangium sp. 'caverna']AWS44283.1 hydrolase [Streptosporangium sp. 'caverna']